MPKNLFDGLSPFSNEYRSLLSKMHEAIGRFLQIEEPLSRRIVRSRSLGDSAAPSKAQLAVITDIEQESGAGNIWKYKINLGNLAPGVVDMWTFDEEVEGEAERYAYNLVEHCGPDRHNGDSKHLAFGYNVPKVQYINELFDEGKVATFNVDPIGTGSYIMVWPAVHEGEGDFYWFQAQNWVEWSVRCLPDNEPPPGPGTGFR